MFLKKLTIKSLKYQKKSKIISFQKMYASDLKIDVKFSCENELVDKLSSNLVSEENHKFSYYDSSSDSYPLGKKDIWLFKKDGNWECKAALANEQNETHINKKPTEVLPTYRESFGELEIRRELNLQQDVTKQPQRTLEEDLKLKSIEPICNFSSNIKTYKLNDLKISIENTDFNYHHGTLSAEISNATSEDVKKVESQLNSQIKKLNLKIDNVRTPIEELLFKNSKENDHYNILKESNVIRN